MGEKTGVLAGDQLRTRPITSSHKGLKKRRSRSTLATRSTLRTRKALKLPGRGMLVHTETHIYTKRLQQMQLYSIPLIVDHRRWHLATHCFNHSVCLRTS